MQIAIEIPDNIAGMIAPDRAPARAALEAIALEGYRSKRLGESAVRRLLGFTTRMQVHEFLKEHGLYIHYDMDDLEHDMREVDRVTGLMKARKSSVEQHRG